MPTLREGFLYPIQRLTLRKINVKPDEQHYGLGINRKDVQTIHAEAPLDPGSLA